MNIEFYTKQYNSEYISSRNNPKIVYLSKLSNKKFRDESGLFLAEGIKLSKEALNYADVERIIVNVDVIGSGDIANILGNAMTFGVNITILSREAFEKISTEKAPQGIISVVRYCSNISHENFVDWQTEKRLIMLDEIRDPGNLGTIMRSAEALGINGIILSSCADIYNNKTVRAAMGTIFRLPIFISANGVECVKQLKLSNRRVIGAALGRDNLVLGKYQPLHTDCVIIGNEGHGISKDILNECNACVKIPMTGNTESLNAAQAATCILWEYQRIN